MTTRPIRDRAHHGRRLASFAVIAGSMATAMLSGDAATAAPPEPIDNPTLAGTAAQLCTAAVNTAVTTILPEVDAEFILVDISELDGADPSTEQIETWVAALAAANDRSATVSAALDQLPLDELAPGDAEARTAWNAIVEADTAQVLTRRSRIELLQHGEWSDLLHEWLRTRVDDDLTDVVDALEQLGLQHTDCAWPRALQRYTTLLDPAAVAYLNEAAVACSTIFARRLANDFEPASETVLQHSAVLYGVDGEPVPTDELHTALTVVVDEWRQTADDLRAVDVSDVPDAAQPWADVIAAAEERYERAAARLAAVDDPDDPAWALGGLVWPGVDFVAAGLDSRSCAAVRS